MLLMVFKKNPEERASLQQVMDIPCIALILEESRPVSEVSAEESGVQSVSEGGLESEAMKLQLQNEQSMKQIKIASESV